MATLALLLVMAVAPAQEESLPPPPLLEIGQRAPPASAAPRFGLRLDAGLPDGLGASATWRPLRLAELSLGVVTSGTGAGARGGLTLLLPLGPVSPTLSAEVGRMFPGSVPWVFEVTGGERYTDLFRRVEYDFANLHLGVEVGGRRFRAFARAGLSQVHATGTELGVLARAQGEQITSETVILRLRTPSAKVGVVVFL